MVFKQMGFGRRYSEVDGSGASERAGGGDNVHNVGEIRRCKVVDGLKGVHKDFELNSESKCS